MPQKNRSVFRKVKIVSRQVSFENESVYPRRAFLQGGAASVTSAALLAKAEAVSSASSLISVGIMGVNGRGKALARGFAQDPRARIVALCDVDTRVAGPLAEQLAKEYQHKPRVEVDVRRLLDDHSIDALVVATPNHWHAPATILGCRAGKHVYVEKPCSHTAEEGELAEAAARQHNRVVTMGSQRRTWPAIREAIALVRSGVLGEVHLARSWYANRRGPMGIKKPTPPPSWLHWGLWQGPAPERPFRDNVVHYNWHWLWHWGDGELGNNGVHAVDLARWGLNVEFPIHTSAIGGRYHYEDDQETPDTMSVAWAFPDNKMITWEGLSCIPNGLGGNGFGVTFVGTDGSIVIDGGGYRHLDPKGKVLVSQTGDSGDAGHISNFLDCIVNTERPNADISEAHRSTLLCHLGNIAWRTGAALKTDPENGHIVNHPEASRLWGREYRDEWNIRRS